MRKSFNSLSVGFLKERLEGFPEEYQRDVGQALYPAQRGEEYPSVKALKGFGGRSMLEIVAPDDVSTYREKRLAAAERDYRERQN